MPAKGTLKLDNIRLMSAAQRRELANWLKQQAADVVIDGKDYADRFTSRSQQYAVEKKP